MKKFLTAMAMASTLMLSACGSAEGEIEAAFKEYYEKPLCLTHKSFPFAEPTRGQRNWVSPLIDEGYIDAAMEASPYGVGQSPVAHYNLTKKGRKHVTPEGYFCYGETTVVEVVDMSDEIEDKNRGKLIRAEVLLKHKVTESWAKEPEMKEYVKIGEETVTRTFVHKQKAGWVLDR